MAFLNKYTYSTGIFGVIVSAIVAFEGYYSNDLDDPGGETKYGITLKTARNYGYQGELIDLPLSLAQQIYVDEYIIKPKFDTVIEITPALGHKLVDAGVNCGIVRSSLWFQKALNALSRDGSDYPKIAEDGIIGINTLKSYKMLLEKRGTVKGCQLIMKLVDGQQSTYYMSLDHLNKYTNGWIDNRIQNIPLSYCENYVIPDLKPNKEQQGLDK